MSEKDYFEKMADAVVEDTVDISTYPNLRRQIILAMKQVERDTRHAAMDQAYKCASAIQDLRLTDE